MLFEAIFLVLCAIIFSVLFLSLINGMMHDTAMLRLTRSSFKVDLVSTLDLWLAYSISSLMVLYIYFIPQSINGLLQQNELLSHSQMNEYVTVISLMVIYLGRVITKYHGKSSGQAYFTTIITFGLIRLIIEHGIAIIPNISYDNYLNLFKLSLDLFDPTIFILGSFLLAGFGELLLSLTPSFDIKSLSDLMSSDGVVLDSPRIVGKLEKILTNENIDVVKCITSSMWLIRRISEIDKKHYLNFNKNNLKIIKLPNHLKQYLLAEEIMSRGPSLDLVFGLREKEISERFASYISGLDLLKSYDTRDYNFGKMQFIIIEYLNGKKCMILFVSDTDHRGNILGIYIANSFIIELYSHIFNEIWASSKSKRYLRGRQLTLKEWRYR